MKKKKKKKNRTGETSPDNQGRDNQGSTVHSFIPNIERVNSIEIVKVTIFLSQAQ